MYLPKESKSFTELVEDFENLPRALGRNSTRLWVLDYQKFMEFADYDNFNYDYFETDSASNKETNDILGELDLVQLPSFFEIADYKHWNGTVHWEKVNGIVSVDKFVFSTAFRDCETEIVRVRLMERWREIARKYPQFEVTVWEWDGFFVDQVLNLKMVTFQTVGITLVTMAVVCFLFIPK